MMMDLLDIFDAEGGYKRAKVERLRQRKGYRGWNLGGGNAIGCDDIVKRDLGR